MSGAEEGGGGDLDPLLAPPLTLLDEGVFLSQLSLRAALVNEAFQASGDERSPEKIENKSRAS